MDSRTSTRIKKLENADVDSLQDTDEFSISEELYNKLDLAQQEWLPDHVKVDVQISEEYEAITMAFFNDEITYEEYKDFENEILETDELTDADFQECFEKYGGLRYSWTPERLEELRKGRVPKE